MEQIYIITAVGAAEAILSIACRSSFNCVSVWIFLPLEQTLEVLFAPLLTDRWLRWSLRALFQLDTLVQSGSIYD